MSEQQSHIEYLFREWINGQATNEQVNELMALLGQVGGEEQLHDIMNKGWNNLANVIELSDEQKSRIAQKAIGERGHEMPVMVHRVHFIRRWGWAAASVLLLMAATAYWLTNNKKNIQSPDVPVKIVDIAPGRDGAILTLADNRQVVLDSLENGMIANQNGAQVILKDGQVTYKNAVGKTAELVYNTMSTPKGRQFKLILPDGSKVWLNAASSITYPVVFTGQERAVSITGEAYFEVAKDKTKPFHVRFTRAGGQPYEVTVLGTHFNIKAYNNEPVASATLLEGKVKVMNLQSAANESSLVLKPGEQAVAASNASLTIDRSPDIDKVMAWKNGLFNFEGATLEEIMKQLERWYDIEVVYENGVPGNLKLGGEMTRGVTLNGLLTGLQQLGLHFRMDGRKLIILP